MRKINLQKKVNFKDFWKKYSWDGYGKAPKNDEQIASQIEALYPGKVEAFGDDGSVIVNIKTEDKELREIISNVIWRKYSGKVTGDGVQSGCVWLDGEMLN